MIRSVCAVSPKAGRSAPTTERAASELAGGSRQARPTDPLHTMPVVRHGQPSPNPVCPSEGRELSPNGSRSSQVGRFTSCLPQALISPQSPQRKSTRRPPLNPSTNLGPRSGSAPFQLTKKVPCQSKGPARGRP